MSKPSLPMTVTALSANYGDLQVQRGGSHGSSFMLRVFLKRGKRTTKLDNTTLSDGLFFPLYAGEILLTPLTLCF